MNYNELLSSSDWVNSISASYIDQTAPIVKVFKLDKNGTRVNPIYNEEIDGRKYIRPFEIHGFYKTNPFNFSIDGNGMISETDNTLSFYFNFNKMVQTINSLKGYTSSIQISTTNYKDDTWFISKKDGIIRLYRKNSEDDIILDTSDKKFDTLYEISYYLDNMYELGCICSGNDYSRCIPDFKEIEIKGSVLLKCFNSEFKNCSDIIDQGDLIYIPTTNALYEVNSSFPVNNSMFKYVNWQCNCTRTFAYVNYETLKSYPYGYNMPTEINNTNISNASGEEELKDFSGINKLLDSINGEIV